VPGGPELGVRVIVGPIIVNVAEAVSAAGFPVAVITYEPAGMLATTNEAVSMPPDTEHVKLEIEPASLSAHVVSPVEKPAPDTWTVDPTWVEVGLRAIAGELLANWKFADAGMPGAPGFAVIVYEPGVPPGIKVPVRMPPVREHDCVTIGSPVNVQPIAVGSKPDPVTRTVIPAWPIVGFKVMVGVMTVKTADATSLVGVPLTVIGSGPPGAPGFTVNATVT
jgi:hypothetical protein